MTVEDGVELLELLYSDQDPIEIGRRTRCAMCNQLKPGRDTTPRDLANDSDLMDRDCHDVKIRYYRMSGRTSSPSSGTLAGMIRDRFNHFMKKTPAHD